jgi:hypothetical protein
LDEAWFIKSIENNGIVQGQPASMMNGVAVKACRLQVKRLNHVLAHPVSRPDTPAT